MLGPQNVFDSVHIIYVSVRLMDVLRMVFVEIKSRCYTDKDILNQANKYKGYGPGFRIDEHGGVKQHINGEI